MVECEIFSSFCKKTSVTWQSCFMEQWAPHCPPSFPAPIYVDSNVMYQDHWLQRFYCHISRLQVSRAFTVRLDTGVHVHLAHQSPTTASAAMKESGRGLTTYPTYSLWYKLVLMHRGNMSERTDAERDGWRADEASSCFSTHTKKEVVLFRPGPPENNNNLQNVFLSFPFLTMLSLLL